MKPLPQRFLLAPSLCLLAAAWASAVFAQDDKQEDYYGKLTHVQSVPRDDLSDCNSVTITKDGKFAYVSSWGASAVNVFSRDPNTGHLEHVQTLRSFRDLDGVTSIVLSPDERYAGGSAFSSQTAVLFSRDAETGKLRVLDVARQDENAVTGLVWAIDLVFSPDGKFLYVVDPKGPGRSNPAAEGKRGAITAFEVTNLGKLRWIEANPGKDDCLNGARGIAAHSNGRWLYVASSAAASVTFLERDPKSGKVTPVQIIRDEIGDARGLNGAMTPALSPDEKFLYVCCGRFSGDNGVSVFAIGEDGTLSVVQELSNELGDIKNFVGGNVLAISPDGRNLYAAATRSGTLACFTRDPNTGKLTWKETLQDNAGAGELGGAAGVAVSPDGRFVYVTAEYDDTMTVYQRHTPDKTSAE